MIQRVITFVPAFRAALKIAVATGILLTMSTSQGFADEVRIKNGDTITGEFLSKQGEFIKFKTTYAGILSIKWADIKEIRTDKEIDENLAKQLGAVADRPAVEAGSDGTKKGGGSPGGPIVLKPALKKADDFMARLNFAAKLENGNTDSDEFDVDFELRYRRDQHRYDFKGQLEYDRDDGTNTKKDWDVAGKYDYYLDERNYASSYYAAKQEKFAGLNLRQYFGLGIGRDFLTNSDHRLSAELGLLRVSEDYRDFDDDQYLGIGFFLQYERKLFDDRLTFYHRNHALLDSGNIGKNVWHSWTGFRYPLSRGLVASTEFEIDYDSEPTIHAEKLDTTLRFKLGYEW